MAKQSPSLIGFNRGLVSRLALARVDVKRMALSSSVQVNWMPRVLGSMMLRPGLGYIGASFGNKVANFLDFIFATDDTALLEITDAKMRVWVDDDLVSRVAVSSAVTNGTFDTDVTSWTDADEAGAVSSWLTGGYLSLVGTGTLSAIRRQQVTVAGADQNVRHALRIVIARGEVTLRVGSTSGDDDYFNETVLLPGSHSLAFTPGASFWIEFSSSALPAALVDSVAVEAAGPMEVTAPWLEADISAPTVLRWTQSADVLYIAADGYRQYKIERRATDSWSVVQYLSPDGPFRLDNATPTSLAASAISGDITLTASRALFRSGHLGALFRLTSAGQNVSSSISAQNTFTNTIQVTGVSTSRSFSVSLTGVWSATVTLQRSFDEGVSWIDAASYTSNTTTTYSDGLDNQIVLYRIGVKTGDYTSGTVAAALGYTLGSITGIARVTLVTSATVVNAAVLTALGSTTATAAWAEGEWSPLRGFPSAVALFDGRLWWAGIDKIWGSVSDAFDSFDDSVEGDSGPINRSLGSGPIKNCNWLLPMQRLLAGTDGAEISIRSSSLDAPLTPTDFTPRPASTQGSAAVAGGIVDVRGVFVQRSGTRLYELAFDGTGYSYNDYSATDLTSLIPEIGEPSIVRIAIQRQPDTRIHCVRSDGTAAVLVYDRVEEVRAWLEIQTDGVIIDIVVLPAVIEDAVYYHVERTINGATVRYLEKWALESECQGAVVCKLADSHLIYDDVTTTVITGLDHLEGEAVVVWADGIDLSPGVGVGQTTYTVTAGQITLGVAVEQAAIGLPYSGTWESTKLAYATDIGTTLLQRKKVTRFGAILADTHPKGLEYGPDFTTMDALPQIEAGAVVDPDAVWVSLDSELVTFPGTWGPDSRLCMRATAPRPVTVLAAVLEMESY